MRTEICKNCDNQILVMAFIGTGYCSVNCKKAAGKDVPSVGTYMFVTEDEKKMIGENRA